METNDISMKKMNLRRDVHLHMKNSQNCTFSFYYPVPYTNDFLKISFHGPYHILVKIKLRVSPTMFLEKERIISAKDLTVRNDFSITEFSPFIVEQLYNLWNMKGFNCRTTYIPILGSYLESKLTITKPRRNVM